MKITGILMHFFHEARFFLSRKYKSLKWLAKDDTSIWKCLFETVNQKDIQDWAVVYLNEGVIYMGYISKYTYNRDNEHRIFLLNKAKCVDEELKEKYLVDGVGVFLNTRNVNRIEFIKGEENKLWKNPPKGSGVPNKKRCSSFKIVIDNLDLL